jgi:hypothetical protein
MYEIQAIKRAPNGFIATVLIRTSGFGVIQLDAEVPVVGFEQVPEEVRKRLFQLGLDLTRVTDKP